jgi:DNA replication protein DnaC
VIPEQTLDKMRRMRMNHLAQTLADMDRDPAYDSVPFPDRIGMLIDAEWEYRRTHKTTLLVKRAGFTDPSACVEAIDYRPERGLDRTTILSLATGGYIDARHDIVILGSTGAGKSFLAQALGVSACRGHHSVRYTRMTTMLDDIAIARATGASHQALDEWVKPEVLILDDYMLTQPTREGVNHLLDLTEKRLHTGSTIYCSQLAPDQWHQRVEEAIIADAILDRIVNRARLIHITGDSMRRRNRPTA